MRPPTAIFVSGIDYESPIRIGDHHLAYQFAAHGWEVAFLSTPLTHFHLFSQRKAAIHRRWQTHRKGGHTYSIGAGRLWSYVPTAWYTPKNLPPQLLPLMFKHQQPRRMPVSSAALDRQGYREVDLLYIRDPYQAYMLQTIHYCNAVFRMADNDDGFFATQQPYYQWLQAYVASQVDLIAYTSELLAEKVRAMPCAASLYLPNGVDYGHFNQANLPKPPAYQHLNGPIVVYVGSIDEWFDFGLVNWLSSSLPACHFVIIGPVEGFRHRFAPHDNLHILGPVDHASLPPYLVHAQLGLIPFDVQQNPSLVNYINPLKVYEYLASGLPVVATRWQALQQLHLPISLCSSYGDFFKAIQQEIIQPTHPPSVRRQSAVQYDWSQIYYRLIAALGEG